MQIRKTGVAIKGGPGGIGFYANKDNGNQVTFNDGTTDRLATPRVPGYQAKTADYTVVLPSDNGKVFTANAAATVNFTLPAVSAANKGMRVTVVTQTQPGSGAGTTVTPDDDDRIKFKADAAALVNTAGTDAAGDLVTLESDGVDGWIVVAQVGVWA